MHMIFFPPSKATAKGGRSTLFLSYKNKDNIFPTKTCFKKGSN